MPTNANADGENNWLAAVHNLSVLECI